MKKTIRINSTYEFIRVIYDNSIIEDDNNKGRFWHYTSLNSVISMFDEYIKNDDKKNVKNCSIWASNVRYMNDPSEYREGREILNNSQQFRSPDYCSELKDRYCLISFSKKGDNLGHWKWYGKESGVSICFNMDLIESSMFKKELDEYEDNNRPIKVYYSPKDKTNYLNRLFHAVDNNQISKKSLEALFIPFCKDESYEEEAEYRMVFFENNDSSLDYVYNKNEPGRTKPALNIKMKIRDKNEVDSYYLEDMRKKEVINEDKGNIIERIIVGPGINQELVFNALIHIFDTQYYKYVEFSNDKRKTGRKKIINNLRCGECGWVKDSYDNRIRFAYKCHTGIYILKSRVVFRG